VFRERPPRPPGRLVKKVSSDEDESSRIPIPRPDGNAS
jgi:hypothetical protein